MRVLMFVKYPRPGAVKTRLGATVGAEHAAALQEAFVRDELDMLSGLGAAVTLYCDPMAGLAEYAALYGDLPCRHQHGDDLGARMLAALHDALPSAPDGVVLIGSDLPDLPAGHIEQAFAALGSAPVCIGPAPDGGFHLLGLTAPLPSDIFAGVAWSGPQVLERTLANCRRHGLTPRLLPEWPDVDTFEDLEAYARRNRGRDSHTMNRIRACGPETETWKS